MLFTGAAALAGLPLKFPEVIIIYHVSDSMARVFDCVAIRHHEEYPVGSKRLI